MSIYRISNGNGLQFRSADNLDDAVKAMLHTEDYSLADHNRVLTYSSRGHQSAYIWAEVSLDQVPSDHLPVQEAIS